MYNKNKIMTAMLALACLIPGALSASFVNFQSGATLVPGNSLGPTTTYDGWNELTTGRIQNDANNGNPYGAHNNTSPWTATLASNLGGGNATLFKSGGYGYVAGSSIHQGFPGVAFLEGGTFEVSDVAIAGLETIVFQIEVSHVLGHTFWNNEFPVLHLNGNTLEADFSSRYFREAMEPAFGEDRFLERWAFQWDLSDEVIDTGDAFKVEWTGIGNSGIFALQLNQGEVMAQVVPEPAHYALLSGGLFLGLAYGLRRLKQKRAS